MNSPTNEILPQGYRMTELGPLPEEWEVVQLENKYIEFQNGLWKGKKEPYINVRVLRNTNFNNDGTIDFDDVAELDVEQRNFKNREIIKDDIILERSGGGPTQPVGRVVFFEKNDQLRYSFSNFTSRIRVIDKLKIFPKYLFFYLLDFYYQGKTNDIQNRTTGIRNLDFSKYKQILLPLPPLPEQQKIAAVLSAVQEAKEKTQAVIDATKALKKSMMKHLFTYGPVPPEETENVPLKETEIGKVPEDWEVEKISNYCELLTGGTPNTKIKEYWEPKEIPWMKSGEIQGNKIVAVNSFISKKGLENSNARWLPKKSVVIALAGRGKTRGTTAPLEFDCTCNQSVVCMKPDERISYLYLHYFLANQYSYIRKLTGDKDRSGLNKQIVGNIPILCPPLPVQQKIASILSAIDAKIEAEENKKQALEELFKTLLHNLMTAKIRVNHLEVKV
jgi:type I restriction enzyme S subunit